MPNAYGLEIAYAMKAMPNQHVLKILKSLGSKIDASSFN
jgi:diaminopimelate decarboxylase